MAADSRAFSEGKCSGRVVQAANRSLRDQFWNRYSDFAQRRAAALAPAGLMLIPGSTTGSLQAEMLGLESVVTDEWHVIGASSDFEFQQTRPERLLGCNLQVTRSSPDNLEVLYLRSTGDVEVLPTIQQYGYIWTTLGRPTHGLFTLDEYAEVNRRWVHLGTFGLRASAPRAIENFLDLAHFPFVHPGYLGVEPHTEVRNYDVATLNGGRELVARRCKFQQPITPETTDIIEIEVLYRVPHPYCAILYRPSALDSSRNDLFVAYMRPASEQETVVCLSHSTLNQNDSDAELRRYPQLIFGQDRPIVENHLPTKLPLDFREEMSVRADRSSVMYRRWLLERGVRYGTMRSE